MKIACFPVNMFEVNTYVVWNENSHEAAIIDPGMSKPSEQNRINEFISGHHLSVVALINTHLHIDHTLGNDYVSQHYNVKTQANNADAPLGIMRSEQAARFHLRIPEPTPLHIEHNLENGNRIYLGNEYLIVLTVPGHSPGSIALYSPESKFVITGDALFNGSIGRTDLFGGNQEILLDSIRKKLFSLPDDTKVYPGHGPSTTIGREKMFNPFF
ncbi:MAG: MBL fold metallo-hydrolase [Paramuribaculum sp.]|nr:MBL fold metallo-hydrolase [Paramuribaculum sp.]